MSLGHHPPESGTSNTDSTTGDLSSSTRRALARMLDASTYPEHRNARLAVRDTLDAYVRALRTQGMSCNAILEHVAELTPQPTGSVERRYVDLLREELARWTVAAFHAY